MTTQTTQVIKANKIDTTKFKLAENIKINKYGGKSVFAAYNGGVMRVQLDKMMLPFGISVYTDPTSGDMKYSLDLNMKTASDNFVQQIEKIEDSILDYAAKNSKDLFKKVRNKELLKEFYKSFIKYTEEDGVRSDKYPPRFKAKMWTGDNGKFSADVYMADKVDGRYPKVDLTLENYEEIVSKGCSCDAIVQCSGLWVVGDTFGISWSVVQLKVYPNQNVLSGYAFQDDDEEEQNEDVEDLGEEDDEETEQPVREESPFDEEEVVVKKEEPVVKEKRVRRKKDEF
jgi:hypothetical protein